MGSDDIPQDAIRSIGFYRQGVFVEVRHAIPCTHTRTCQRITQGNVTQLTCIDNRCLELVHWYGAKVDCRTQILQGIPTLHATCQAPPATCTHRKVVEEGHVGQLLRNCPAYTISRSASRSTNTEGTYVRSPLRRGFVGTGYGHSSVSTRRRIS